MIFVCIRYIPEHRLSTIICTIGTYIGLWGLTGFTHYQQIYVQSEPLYIYSKNVDRELSMVNILLLSVNDSTVNIVSKIAGKAGFSLRLEKLPCTGDSGPGEADVILLDMAGAGEMYLKNSYARDEFIKKLPYPGKMTVVVLLPEQADFIIKNIPGIDDFIFFDRLEDELVPRINFLYIKLQAAVPDNSLVVDKMILNLDKYELTVNGRAVELTFKEFELLKILMQNQDRVFTRINLLSSVWQYDFYGGSRTVDVHMRRLRVKIPPPYNNMLKTIRNVGYMFRQDIDL